MESEKWKENDWIIILKKLDFNKKRLLTSYWAISKKKSIIFKIWSQFNIEIEFKKTIVNSEGTALRELSYSI